jgi:hypothetical protein
MLVFLGMGLSVSLWHGSPNRGPSGCITWPAAAIFVNSVCDIKLHSNLNNNLYHVLLFFPRAVCEAVAVLGVVLCYKQFGHPSTVRCSNDALISVTQPAIRYMPTSTCLSCSLRGLFIDRYSVISASYAGCVFVLSINFFFTKIRNRNSALCLGITLILITLHV